LWYLRGIGFHPSQCLFVGLVFWHRWHEGTIKQEQCAKKEPQAGSKPKRKKRHRLPRGVVEKKIYDDEGNVLKVYRYVRIRYVGRDGKMHSKSEPSAGNATDARDVRESLNPIYFVTASKR
jgi:hypothetical protein